MTDRPTKRPTDGQAGSSGSYTSNKELERRRRLRRYILSIKFFFIRDHVAYTMAKYGMSMCVLGMSEEFKKVRLHVCDGAREVVHDKDNPARMENVILSLMK